MSRLSNIIGKYLYVDFGGVEHRVYFEEAGEGIPVLLQHTAGSDGRQWRYLLEDPELTKRFRFIAYDLPFHGKSVPPVGVEWWKEVYELHQDQLIDMVVTIANELGLERAIYMGCSMGGHLAPDLALAHPGFFRAAIGIEGGLATHDEEPFNPYMWHPRVSDEMKQALMFGMMSPNSPEAHRREAAWYYAQGGPAVHKGDLVYYLGEHDVTETAKDIDTSKTMVYVLSGDYDWSATPEHCKALADAIPGAKYVGMTDMGHFPMSEDPKRFNAYAKDVLEEIAATRPN